ncbi:hypothetical protein FRC14_008297 [Serendipita sp. 396]|nr:hypothetical protein FRC14_008297 [Serendipita sp. 396]KAG8783663.1 hypothetical protein FRC15_004768 [Serendipita sp. 397]KAG8799536.1 hypothetical protein FRC16_004897 [Serendipita sp. 398]KAG8838270.1 hypothetical protein FRC18_005474 [Serendipita sp. 400]KAG8870226.1 hypothetical protein FRC20_000214 [Serendipita sp. 405]
MAAYGSRIAVIRDLSAQVSTIHSSIVKEEAHEPPADPIQALIDFDAALSDFEQTIRSLVGTLRGQRNTLSYPCTLPPEILAHIFEYNETHAVTRVAAVCRSWRSAAINCSSLWTTIDMNYLKHPKEYAQLFLSRSGNLPLTIGFVSVANSADIYFQNIQGDFRPFFLRAQAIYNLVPHINHSSYTYPCLKSLHVILSSRTQFKDSLKGLDQLQHLSISFYNDRVEAVSTPLLAQIDEQYYGPRISTLYLQYLNLPADVLLSFLSGFVALRELFLEECRAPYGVINFGNFPAMSTFPKRPLSSLRLKRCSDRFVKSFLDAQARNGVAGTTTLIISPGPPYTFQRERTASSLHVNAATGVFLYTHEEGGKTWIRTDPYKFYSYVPVHAITSITCTGRYPLVSGNLEGFTNLHELSFAFVPDDYSKNNGLEMTLDTNLISFCSNLSYLRLQLPMVTTNGAKSLPRYDDRAEEVLPNFLEKWNRKYKQKFGRVLIEDEVDPARWDLLTDRLRHLTAVFEFKDIVMEEIDPELPRMQVFKPEEHRLLRMRSRKGGPRHSILW